MKKYVYTFVDGRADGSSEMKNLLGGFSWDDADVFDIETNKRNPFSVGITKEGSITLGIAVLNELGYLKENILDADGEPIRKQPAAPSAKEEEDAEKLGSPLKRWNIPEGEILVIRNIKYLDGELLFRIATVKEGYTQIVCPINIQGSGKPQGSYMKLRGISHWHEDNTNANKNATSLRFEEGTGLAVEIDKKTIQLTIAEGEYQENKGVGK